MTHRFFLKLWLEMRLGATVTTRKQNEHRANGRLLILQNQRRPDRFDQMLRSCWLVFLVLMELWTRNLFLLDKLWINNFIWRCWKDHVIMYGKKTWNVEQGCLVPSPQQCSCPHGLECAAVFGKNNVMLIPHPPYSLNLAPCDFFLFPCMKDQMKGKHFADVSKVKKKTLEVLNISST